MRAAGRPARAADAALRYCAAVGGEEPQAAVIETIRLLELALARRDEAAIPGGYASVIDDDFREIGQSSRMWTREETLAMLAGAATSDRVTIVGLEVSFLAGDLLLATYDLHGVTPDGSVRQSRRSSIWRRHDGAWRMRFHQGTPVPVQPA